MASSLRALVQGRTDEEIVAGMKALGGIEPILRETMESIRAAVVPTSPDATIGFELRCEGLLHDYTLIVRRGLARLEVRTPYDAPFTLILSAPDFLRLMARELDWEESFNNGFIQYKGDFDYLLGLQAMFGPPPQLSSDT